MADNPYLLDTPSLISFSGGRTSAYMLRMILDAFGGTLPEGIKVVFANTGKERPETLDFVHECETRWQVPITWVEYRFAKNAKKKHAFEIVDYKTASRNGEPFEAIIKARSYLPNVLVRFCTSELKVKTMHRFLRSIGWKNWASAIGIRADEPRRLAKTRQYDKYEEKVFPLAKAGVTEKDVMDYWKASPFDLQLQPHEGNCDLCFLKGAGRIRRIMKDRPDLAKWWIKQEERLKNAAGRVARFRNDRPGYRIQLELAQRPGLFDDCGGEDELTANCSCTD